MASLNAARTQERRTPESVGSARRIRAATEGPELAAIPTVRTMSFGSLRLIPAHRLLLDGEMPVRLGSRALEILIALVERPGELVRKDELLARGWPGMQVIEGNLKFQIGVLRRALGDGRDGRRFIESSPGQGYRFVADVSVGESAAPQHSQPIRSIERNHNLPARLGSLVGRGELIAKLVERDSRERLLTIVGPGGIGKTSVAIAVAEQLVGAYEDGVWIIDLLRVADERLVGSAVATVLGIKVDADDLLAPLIAALSHRRMLIVLDNCGHVIEAAAQLALAILQGAPGVHILATSREPLHVEGERVHRLAPLASPPASASCDTRGALQFPAVQLFVERVAERSDFTLRDEDAPVVSEICRKLDGIPLAIELAAARVGMLGIHGLLARLDDRISLLSEARRTAVPHHRTLRATIDLSYDLLSAAERAVFLRLAVFAGGFTLAASAAVAGDTARPEGEIDQLVFDLVDKSLVIADAEGDEPRFRLLDTTRVYALERLADTDEHDAICRRHAAYYADLLETAVHSTEAHNIAKPEIYNVREALRWAFGPCGDLALGVRLAAAFVPMISLSLLVEDRRWVEKAIASLDGAGLKDTRQEMILEAALGNVLQVVKGPTAEAHRALDRALDLARELGDADYEIRIIHVKWRCLLRAGEIRTALALAWRAESVATTISSAIASQTTGRMLGLSLQYAGELAAASERLTRLAVPPLRARLSHIRRFGYDQCVIGYYQLAHLRVLQGCPEQAARAGSRAVEVARELRDEVTLCGALRWPGSALSLLGGDLDVCRQYAVELTELSARHSLVDHHAFGIAMQAVLALKASPSRRAAEHVWQALGHWHETKWHIYSYLLSDFAELAAKAGYLDEISALNEEALGQMERNQELWVMPEALRLKGELLLLSGSAPHAASAWFDRAIALARAQGALAWELRAAMSIARLQGKQGRADQARKLLQSVYDRFTEGFDTADLKAARQLLDELVGGAGKAVARRHAARRRSALEVGR